MKRKSVFLSLFITSFLLSASALYAHDRGACKADFEKFCSNTQSTPGGGMQCLQSHATELSPDCQASLQKMKERFEAFKNDCGADSQKFCSDVQTTGHWQMMKCLKDHQTELSTSCQTHFQGKM
jgi:hypothetical protein